MREKQGIQSNFQRLMGDVDFNHAVGGYTEQIKEGHKCMQESSPWLKESETACYAQ